MKKSKQNPTVVYTNSQADALIAREVPVFTEKIKTNAIDLAHKALPKVSDPLRIYLPLMFTLFQSLLEKVLRLIGAERLASEIEALKENYKKEEEHLKSIIEVSFDELRLLKKRVKELNQNLGHIMRNWKVALFFLGLLSCAEIFLNYRIFLPLSANNLGAFISATGIAISLFIICHIFPNILYYFQTRLQKWLVGIAVISLVSGLLFSFAKMRLSFMVSNSDMATADVSTWNFLILNLTLFLSGLALTTIYKPSKKIVSDHQLHQKITKELTKKQKEFTATESRLAALTKEKNDELAKLEGIEVMAIGYQKTLEAEYQKSFALWSNENLIARAKTEGVPKCFAEKPTPLTIYFQKK